MYGENKAACPYRHMEVKEIAKIIRKDLKAKFGKGIKFGVTTCRYPREINVKVKEIKADKYIEPFEDFSRDWKYHYSYNDEQIQRIYNARDYRCLSDETLVAIKEILNKYNYDDSDVYTDYFDVNYYTNIS